MAELVDELPRPVQYSQEEWDQPRLKNHHKLLAAHQNEDKAACLIVGFMIDWVVPRMFRVALIRYENGLFREVEDCGELHDDMCGYFEFAGNAAGAEAKQVRTRKSLSLQEEVRSALFGDVRSAIGKRVSVIRDKILREGQV